MVESRGRKAAFLREVVRVLSLDGTTVEPQRIEEVAETAHFHETADLVTVRAVKIQPAVVAAIESLLCQGGLILLFGSASEQWAMSSSLEPCAPCDLDGRVALLIKRKG